VCANSALLKIISSPRLEPSFSAISIAVILLAFVFADAPARSQESPSEPETIVEAARNARERKANSGKHPKVITNADLGVRHPVPPASGFHLPSSSSNAAEAPGRPAASCDNPEAERLARELQAAEQDLDQLRSELSYQPPVISNRDLDLQYFHPGISGLDVGSPPLSDSEAPAPARVTEVKLKEWIASLQKALRIVCEPPDAAGIQIQIDDLEQELNLLHRQFVLDQDTYYSQPDFAEDRAGKTRLDAELQEIQSLQFEIDQLRRQLDALNVPQTT
jgi:hypothetical protein